MTEYLWCGHHQFSSHKLSLLTTLSLTHTHTHTHTHLSWRLVERVWKLWLCQLCCLWSARTFHGSLWSGPDGRWSPTAEYKLWSWGEDVRNEDILSHELSVTDKHIPVLQVACWYCFVPGKVVDSLSGSGQHRTWRYLPYCWCSTTTVLKFRTVTSNGGGREGSRDLW